VTDEEALGLLDDAAVRYVRGCANRGSVSIVLRVLGDNEVRVIAPGIPPAAFRHIVETALKGYESEVCGERPN
jgi:hypothetical protein